MSFPTPRSASRTCPQTSGTSRAISRGGQLSEQLGRSIGSAFTVRGWRRSPDRLSGLWGGSWMRLQGRV
ncbi:hypothetical protein BJX68DRAFT_226059, partial [Aspergillus pseudodeflectus]